MDFLGRRRRILSEDSESALMRNRVQGRGSLNMADQPPVHVPTLVRLRPTPVRLIGASLLKISIPAECKSSATTRHMKNWT